MNSWVMELYKAVNKNDIPAAKSILARDAVRRNGNLGRDEWNADLYEDPLHLAARNGNNEMVEILVAAGVNINSTPCMGKKATALHWTVFFNKESTVKVLLDLGGNPTLRGEYWRLSGTPLDWARKEGQSNVVKILEQNMSSSTNRWNTVQIQNRERAATAVQEHAEVRKPVTSHDILTKAATEKELFDATRVHDQLDTKARRLASIPEEMKRLDDEMVNIDIWIREANKRYAEDVKKLEDEKKAIAAEMFGLQGASTFRSRRKMQELKWKLEDIEALVVTARNMTLVNDSDSRTSCPICFEVPEEIFSCLVCENWICQGCKGRVENCPSCRQDFLSQPPRRNRGIERALGI